ncbi:unnamed protein product [Sphacelaria rigidula]
MDSMRIEFDGLMAAGTSADVTDDPERCNIMGAKGVYEWKGDSHGMVDRAKPRMGAI